MYFNPVVYCSISQAVAHTAAFIIMHRLKCYVDSRGQRSEVIYTIIIETVTHYENSLKYVDRN